MKRIILSASVLILILLLTTCLKPDPIDTSFASDVYLMDVLETGAYARDVYVHDGAILVAASQAGNQSWQEKSDGSV
ncbi:MAG: hypothetical protein HOB84_01415, partial [Candidatus Marinimicrobia bacterium]|nr:hypothetical protein [Candidatus Neomarinimicrobiota bacterium]MBT4946068.1 hypothetical protein [Candidatus Neomarinimicrobiota bacterium]